MKRYISDQHFFSEKVMTTMDHRPFPTVEEMNEYMISQWNDTVKGGDQIFILGDMFDWQHVQNAGEINRVLHRLKGKLYLIRGNHDFTWLNKPEIDLSRFVWIDSMREIDDGDRKVIMNHFPMPVFGGNHLKRKDGSPKIWDLYGHVHDTAEAQFMYDIQEMGASRPFIIRKSGDMDTMACNMINCFCMYSDYRPLSLESWIELHEQRIAARKHSRDVRRDFSHNAGH
ncbi:MAG: metallophosphoesterase [Eubacteriales bacterium]|jgi:calcineurin-like phosphoesterase family protein